MNITGELGSRLTVVANGMGDTFWTNTSNEIFSVSRFPASTGAIPKAVDGGGNGQLIKFDASKGWTGV